MSISNFAPSLARRLALAVVALIAAFAVSGVSTSAAYADDLPFWERDDAAAKKASSKKVSYRKSASSTSKKHYASRKKLGGYAEATEPARKKRHGVRVAALGNTYVPQESTKSLSGGGVRWAASSSCLDSGLRAVIGQVAANYGSVTVNSTCRSKGHNRAVGGAPHSKHLSGDAVDFRVHGNVRAVYAFLKASGSVGGLKHYGGGLFHIDNGERRSW